MTLDSSRLRLTTADRLKRYALGGALWSALSLAVSPAHAEDAEMRTAARDLATQGAHAFEAGHYEQASDLFLRAYQLVPAPSIALLRARSLLKLGEMLSALDIYEQIAHLKLGADAPEAYLDAVETARTEVEDVRRRLPRLKLTVIHTQVGPVPEVTIDDKPTPSALLGVERPMNPGAHRFAVVISGQVRDLQQVSFAEGKSYEVDLDAGRTGQSATPGVRDASDRARRASRARAAHAPLRVWGYVGLGVAAAGFGIGTYTGLVALHDKSALDSACHPGCPESSAADLSGFRSNRTASWLSYGVGVAAATSGILLLTLGKPDHEHVAFRVTAMGMQIGGQL